LKLELDEQERRAAGRALVDRKALLTESTQDTTKPQAVRRGRPMSATRGSFDKLTEAFAAAAVDPTRWDAAMDIASEATDSFGAILVPVRGRAPNFPMSDLMRPVMDDYVRDGWIHRDERYRSVPTFLRRGVSSEFDFTTNEEIARSPFYQEFLGRHRLRWLGGVKIGEGEDIWALALQRSVAQGPFQPDELNRLAALSRRLAGAAELARAFGFARMEGALAAFEASRSPAAAIDRMGEVVRLNRCAERLIGRDLQVVRKRFASSDRDATAALDRALHALIWGGEAFQPAVVLPRHEARPLIAYPSRLSGAAPEGFAACAGFVVFVDLEARLAPDAGAFANAFGLTPAEARLAARLLGEESLETAARRLGVAVETARNQLKRVYEKTGAHRQAQLVGLLARLARPESA
jgi:DNA-binding CsgD family transcriptional regulator